MRLRFTVWASCCKIHPNNDSWEYVAHYHAVSHSDFGEMRWSSVISTRVLQALSQPEPSQSHWSGADAGTAIWSSPSTLGVLKKEKKGGFQYDKRPARPSQTPSSRFLNQNQKLFISQMYRWMGLRPAFTLWMLCMCMYSGA